LWADVRTLAEELLTAPPGYGQPQQVAHFLGAIVLDQPFTSSGYITVRHVIDGQQRLTTLQLMLDAAQWVAQRHGAAMDAQALRILVLNESAIAQHPHEIFKVWPTDRDQPAYQAAMHDDAEVTPELALSAVVGAHSFFVKAIESWAIADGDADTAVTRIKALTQALRDGLKVVVIDLEPGDNAQVIFETLNHRGAPLLAADLIKNMLFQTAVAQQLDVPALYQKYWRELDGDYWRQKISRGRQFVPRIDIFVNYWLVMRLLREVPADRIFVEFRDHLMSQRPDLEELLAEFVRDARTYAALDSQSAESSVGRFWYRVIQAMDSAVVTPVLLWLSKWTSQELPQAQRDRVLAAVESWLIRRALCRLTSKDVNRIVIDLLQVLASAELEHVGEAVEQFLAKQTADSRLWPTDKHVADALQTTPVYKILLRARLRMLLEALEDARRSGKSEQGSCPRGLTVEHVMPQAWREHWGPSLDGVGDEATRDMLVHTLGNLTLVNHKLNPALSNRPWDDETAKLRGLGDTGKRTELLKHSTLKMNADLVAGAANWDDDGIRIRTQDLAKIVLGIWARPAGGVDERVSLEAAERDPMPNEDAPPTEAATSGVTGGKYQPLTDWLFAQSADDIPVTFEDLEEVLGFTLPPSARNHPPYWYSAANSLGKAIAAAGFKPSGANLTTERVRLVRQ
jgi:hypothetical protein